MPNREFDIILIGATGFTGNRAASYFNTHAPDSLKWGIAARNSQKLDQVRQQLDLPEEQCFVVDTTVREQVEDIAQKTDIIVTTVGPYSLYGEEVIAACARNGTHYLDITGEVGFIKKMKDQYGAEVKESGALLISFCGFDSIPAEVASYLLSQKFVAAKTLDIKSHYTVSGGFNGGTIATMLNKFETGEYKQMNDPRLLMDGEHQQLHRPEMGQFFGYDGRMGRWSVPFIMSGINSKVIYKTSEWMTEHRAPYAKSIAYSEHLNVGRWYNPIPFLAVSLFLISLKLLGPQSWFRSLIKKVMPEPGEGPSELSIQNGFFRLLAVAENNQGKTESVQLSYPGDPGNKTTVFFLCECALLLSAKKENLNKKGFLTPISAFEDELVNHLESKGLKIEYPEIEV